ncbi:MAG: hypothetical protein HC808_08610 [Candidatus Competibacteraceae bacterium]|nr:hypothetical protein [Candidatus Competibacteraceae bacterium]
MASGSPWIDTLCPSAPWRVRVKASTAGNGVAGSLTETAGSGLVEQAVTYAYDNDLRVSEIAYAGQMLPVTYDTDGLLTGVGNLALSRDLQNGLLTQITDGDFENQL